MEDLIKDAPYKIIKRLGEGGFGEVFLAMDNRLHRQVAMKRLKKSAQANEMSRLRFQREARLAASLNHRAIVQVYDVVQWEDDDWIIMEYVQGQSLRQLLNERGPLSLRANLDLALDLAAGLEHAHEIGVVHRDLKPENVLLDANNRTKITDFGIAKSMTAEEADQSLSEVGALVGTIYAMSPEQVIGNLVYSRSDLFSLGVLLYETTTGISPFKGASRNDSLNRVLNLQPPPVNKLSPQMGQAFSDVIMQLLQKKPELRPRNARSVFDSIKAIKNDLVGVSLDAATLDESMPSPHMPALKPEPKGYRPYFMGLLVLLALISGWFLFRTTPQAMSLLRVAVMEPQVINQGKDLDRILAGVSLVTQNTLRNLKQVALVEDHELLNRDGALPEIARAVAADEFLRYQIQCDDHLCELAVERVAASGEILWQSRLPFSGNDELQLSRALGAQLVATYSRPKVFADLPDILDGDDYSVYLSLRVAFQKESIGKAEIVQHLGELRHRSPDFLEAYLLEARVLGDLFQQTREEPYLEQGLALLEEAKKLAPQNPGPIREAFYLALKAGRPKMAEKELNHILQFGEERADTLKMRAALAEQNQDQEEALRLNRLSAELVPSSKNLYNLANLERRSGLVDLARTHYGLALEQDPHNLSALRNLAYMELMSGDVSHAASLLTELIKSNAANTQSITNLSLALLLLGRYDEAVTTARQAYEQSPRRTSSVLNLADALQIADRREEAQVFYKLVLELIDQELDSDLFLAERAQALAQLGNRLEAVEAIQQALRLKPEDPETAYAAALVYCLVGDQTSALLNANRAIQNGFAPRWFEFPWFASLQDNPDFKVMLPLTQ